jgi:outer membrane protein OmpA-like peptidoglycan-associated protein
MSRVVRAILFLLVAASLFGCAQPKPKYSERIILLPSKDGRKSSVVVRRATGEFELAAPYQSVELINGLEQKKTYAEEDLQQRYGEVLEVQPARPFTYTLYFIAGMTQLTTQSKEALNEVTQKIKSFPAAQVTVIGHTDRVGSDAENDVLSLRRASTVRDMLLQIGIRNEAIEVVGRGEREPLVRTANGVSEEKNRRVEIKLR